VRRRPCTLPTCRVSIARPRPVGRQQACFLTWASSSQYLSSELLPALLGLGIVIHSLECNSRAGWKTLASCNANVLWRQLPDGARGSVLAAGAPTCIYSQAGNGGVGLVLEGCHRHSGGRRYRMTCGGVDPAEGSQAHWRPASMGGLAQAPARGVDNNDSSSRHAVRKCTVHSDPPTPAVNGSHQRASQLGVDSAYAKKRYKAAWLSDDCPAILPRQRTLTRARILPR